MDNIKQYIIDFIEGKADPDKFIKDCETDPSIFDWLQTLVPDGEMMDVFTGYSLENGRMVAKIEKVPHTIRRDWEDLTMPSYGRIGIILNVQWDYYQMLKEAFPDEKIEFNEKYRNRNNLILDVCPSYICGCKAEELVDKIIDENPKASKKALREIIKKSFHIVGRRYPRWAQDSDWPFSKSGKPLRYLYQKNINSEVIELTFEDVDTKEIVKVTDIY